MVIINSVSILILPEMCWKLETGVTVNKKTRPREKKSILISTNYLHTELIMSVVFNYQIVKIEHDNIKISLLFVCFEINIIKLAWNWVCHHRDVNNEHCLLFHNMSTSLPCGKYSCATSGAHNFLLTNQWVCYYFNEYWYPIKSLLTFTHLLQRLNLVCYENN